MPVVIPLRKQSRVPTEMLTLGSGTWVDTGGRLSGVPTYSDATGWSLSLTGNWAATDPFDGPHLIFPPITAGGDGAGLDLTHVWSCLLEVIERTAPDLSSDIVVYAGLCNEAADSGTIDAVFGGIRYNVATRVCRKGHVANGAVTGGDGGTDAGIRIAAPILYKQGTGATSRWSVYGDRGLDAAGAPVAAATWSTVNHGAAGGDSAPRPFIAVGRISTTDVTTRALAFDVRRGPLLGTRVAL